MQDPQGKSVVRIPAGHEGVLIRIGPGIIPGGSSSRGDLGRAVVSSCSTHERISADVLCPAHNRSSWLPGLCHTALHLAGCMDPDFRAVSPWAPDGPLRKPTPSFSYRHCIRPKRSRWSVRHIYRRARFDVSPGQHTGTHTMPGHRDQTDGDLKTDRRCITAYAVGRSPPAER